MKVAIRCLPEAVRTQRKEPFTNLGPFEASHKFGSHLNLGWKVVRGSSSWRSDGAPHSWGPACGRTLGRHSWAMARRPAVPATKAKRGAGGRQAVCGVAVWGPGAGFKKFSFYNTMVTSWGCGNSIPGGNPLSSITYYMLHWPRKFN